MNKKRLGLAALSALILAGCQASSDPADTGKASSEAASIHIEDNTPDAAGSQHLVDYSNLKVGDSADIDGLTFTLDQAQMDRAASSSESKAQPSAKLLIHYTLHNASSEDYPAGSDLSASAGGHTLAKDYSSSRQTLPAGQSFSGIAAFTLSDKPDSITLTWKPYTISGASASYQITPE